MEDGFGKAAVILMNHGHPRSEVARYSWTAMELMLTDIAEMNGSKKRRAFSDDDEVEVVGPGLTRRPMPRDQYLRFMGVTDPRERAKLMKRK